MPEELFEDELGEDRELVSKKTANYRAGDVANSCATCDNFLDPDSCRLVSGTIQTTGLCDLFQRAIDTQAVDQQLFGGELGG